MAKQKYVPKEEAPTAGIGPDVDLNSLPVNIVTDAVKRQADPALLRAGVKDPFLPSEPVCKDTIKSNGADPLDRNYNKTPSPFVSDAPVVTTTKSMSHPGTVVTKR